MFWKLRNLADHHFNNLLFSAKDITGLLKDFPRQGREKNNQAFKKFKQGLTDLTDEESVLSLNMG